MVGVALAPAAMGQEQHEVSDLVGPSLIQAMQSSPFSLQTPGRKGFALPAGRGEKAADPGKRSFLPGTSLPQGNSSL